MRSLLLPAVLSLSIHTSVYAPENGSSPQHTAAVNYFKSGMAKQVEDAAWASSDTFNVGVLNDGTSRNDVAAYVCEELAKYGFAGKGIWVNVVDIFQLARIGRRVKLGEARCR